MGRTLGEATVDNPRRAGSLLRAKALQLISGSKEQTGAGDLEVVQRAERCTSNVLKRVEQPTNIGTDTSKSGGIYPIDSRLASQT